MRCLYAALATLLPGSRLLSLESRRTASVSMCYLRYAQQDDLYVSISLWGDFIPSPFCKLHPWGCRPCGRYRPGHWFSCFSPPKAASSVLLWFLLSLSLWLTRQSNSVSLGPILRPLDLFLALLGIVISTITTALYFSSSLQPQGTLPAAKDHQNIGVIKT